MELLTKRLKVLRKKSPRYFSRQASLDKKFISTRMNTMQHKNKKIIVLDFFLFSDRFVRNRKEVYPMDIAARIDQNDSDFVPLESSRVNWIHRIS